MNPPSRSLQRIGFPVVSGDRLDLTISPKFFHLGQNVSFNGVINIRFDQKCSPEIDDIMINLAYEGSGGVVRCIKTDQQLEIIYFPTTSPDTPKAIEIDAVICVPNGKSFGALVVDASEFDISFRSSSYINPFQDVVLKSGSGTISEGKRNAAPNTA
ncbi:hypothetical protein B0T10DRAFT_467505 [Thelonectria olida]|uniref:Uncharacterized protein n=1 Tax=Thelonectria olida TaxID=1576542 RepID=A0A9P8VQT1_9HYPO|nr:hypothetical protein B0T10DRAFT_467505 [Thelonectria olida]